MEKYAKLEKKTIVNSELQWRQYDRMDIQKKKCPKLNTIIYSEPQS